MITDGKFGYIAGYEDGRTDATRECICSSLRAVLADRERELLELKGPCRNVYCKLHYAHSGPCDVVGTARP